MVFTKNKIAALAAFSVLFSSAVNSSPQLIQKKGGYTQVIVDTKTEQKKPLLKIRTVVLPSSVENVGQALNFILFPSGYSLKDLKATEDKVLNLYSLNVPMVNRHFEISTTEQIINTLIGQGYSFSVDDLSRMITITTTKG